MPELRAASVGGGGFLAGFVFARGGLDGADPEDAGEFGGDFAEGFFDCGEDGGGGGCVFVAEAAGQAGLEAGGEGLFADKGLQAVAGHKGTALACGVDEEKDVAVHAADSGFSAEGTAIENPEGVTLERDSRGYGHECGGEADLGEAAFECLDGTVEAAVIPGAEDGGDVTDTFCKPGCGAEKLAGLVHGEAAPRAFGRFLVGWILTIRALHFLSCDLEQEMS